MKLLKAFQQTLENYDPRTTAVAVDFETYYDDDYSVADSTYWHYCHDPRFDAYMVSVYCPDLGISYVGSPMDFDWTLIDGLLWLAHNSPFDRAVWDRLVELAPESHTLRKAQPMAWVNTADLAAYNHAGRSLVKACRAILKRVRSKQVRNDMKGRKYKDLDAQTRQSWLDYAMDDAVDCYDLWEAKGHEWPLIEQQLSLHTSECVKRGVKVDAERVDKSIEGLTRAVDAAERQIPWAGEQELTPKTKKPRFNKDGSPILMKPTSPKQLALYAREQGIPMPSSTEAKSEEFQEWERKYGDKFPVIGAIQLWRKCNRLLRVFEQIKSRIRDDGRMELQMCYYGAQATGRWAGRPGGGASRGKEETGLNMQNLSKDQLALAVDGTLLKRPKVMQDNGWEKEVPHPDEHYYIDVRASFVAGEGKVFGISDLSQIEPRCLASIVGDEPFLAECRKGISPYEAHARASMGWTGGVLKEEDKDQYAFSKARVLSLGYNAGFLKFIYMAAMYVGPDVFDKVFKKPVTQKNIDDFFVYLGYHPQGEQIKKAFPNQDADTQNTWVNSWLQVTDYRQTNPLVTAYWKQMQSTFNIACTRKEDWFLTLPSGRRLAYLEPRKRDGKASRFSGGGRVNVYGGLITENVVQATARDAFGEGIIRLEKAGYPVIWHVHDEVIAEVEPQTDIEDVNKILAQAPSWMPDLPVEAEGELSPHYKK